MSSSFLSATASLLGEIIQHTSLKHTWISSTVWTLNMSMRSSLAPSNQLLKGYLRKTQEKFCHRANIPDFKAMSDCRSRMDLLGGGGVLHINLNQFPYQVHIVLFGKAITINGNIMTKWGTGRIVTTDQSLAAVVLSDDYGLGQWSQSEPWPKLNEHPPTKIWLDSTLNILDW